jgi:hypothetical protein
MIGRIRSMRRTEPGPKTDGKGGVTVAVVVMKPPSQSVLESDEGDGGLEHGYVKTLEKLKLGLLQRLLRECKVLYREKAGWQ